MLEKDIKTGKKAIVISGTPGTGKTSLAKELSLLFKKELILTTDFAKKEGLYEEFDKKRDSYVVDQAKLAKKLAEKVKNSEDYLFIEGHMSHFLAPKHVKLCIICSTELSELKKRLTLRDYSKKKVRENLDCEIFEICYNEAIEIGHKPIKIDTSKNLDLSVKNAKEIVSKSIN